jgi:hypothetical protein
MPTGVLGHRRPCRRAAGGHQALGLQRAQRLAHRRPADRQGLRQLPLGGQGAAGGQLAGEDRLADLLGDQKAEGVAADHAKDTHGDAAESLEVMYPYQRLLEEGS